MTSASSASALLSFPVELCEGGAGEAPAGDCVTWSNLFLEEIGGNTN